MHASSSNGVMISDLRALLGKTSSGIEDTAIREAIDLAEPRRCAGMRGEHGGGR